MSRKSLQRLDSEIPREKGPKKLSPFKKTFEIFFFQILRTLLYTRTHTHTHAPAQKSHDTAKFGFLEKEKKVGTLVNSFASKSMNRISDSLDKKKLKITVTTERVVKIV